MSIVGQFYAYFDFPQISPSQQSMGHIIQNSTRDERVGCWGIYALYQAYQRHGDLVVNIVKATYPLAFHHFIHEEYEDPLAYQALVQLSCLALRIEKDKKDPVYLRALAVFQEAWQTRMRAVWLQLPSLIKASVPLNLSEVARVSLDTLPLGLGVLQSLVSTGYSFWLLRECPSILTSLLAFYDLGAPESVQAATVFKSLAALHWKTRRADCMQFLMSTALSTDVRQSEPSGTGMATQDERRDLQATESAGATRGWHSSTKLFSAKVLLFLAKAEAKSMGTTTVIDDFVKLAGHLCASENHHFKLAGMKTFKLLYREFAQVPDPAEPTTPYLRLFEAHIQAGIRPYLSNCDPVLIVASTKLLEVVLSSGTITDKETIARLVHHLLSTLSSEVKVPLIESFNEQAACSVHYSRLLTLCKLYEGGQVDQSLFVGSVEHMKSHAQALATDMCLILLGESQVKGLNFEREIVSVGVKHIGEIEVVLQFLSRDKGLEGYLMAVCTRLLFVPFKTFETSTFSTQKCVDRFLRRRISLLTTLKGTLTPETSDQLFEEVAQCLSYVAKDPSLEIKSKVLEICEILIPKVTDVHTVRDMENLILKLHIHYSALHTLTVKAWAACVQQYISFLKDDVLDEYSDMESFKVSIFDFCKEAAKLRAEGELGRMVGVVVKETLEKDLKRAICEDCLMFVWTTWPAEDSTPFLLRTLSTLPACLDLVPCLLRELRSAISKRDRRAAGIMGQLARHTTLFPHFSKEIVAVFTMRKEEELNEEETLVVSEAIKIVLLLYKQSANRDSVVSSLLPLLISAYYKHTPPALIKTVTQALQYFISSSPLPCRDFLGQLPEHEKNYLKEVLSKKSEPDAVAASKAQGSIQLKIKKF